MKEKKIKFLFPSFLFLLMCFFFSSLANPNEDFLLSPFSNFCRRNIFLNIKDRMGECKRHVTKMKDSKSTHLAANASRHGKHHLQALREAERKSCLICDIKHFVPLILLARSHFLTQYMRLRIKHSS